MIACWYRFVASYHHIVAPCISTCWKLARADFMPCVLIIAPEVIAMQASTWEHYGALKLALRSESTVKKAPDLSSLTALLAT